MDFTKKQPQEQTTEAPIDLSITWGDGFGLPKRPDLSKLFGLLGFPALLQSVREPEPELDESFYVIDEDGKPKRLSRTAVAVAYAGDQRLGQGQNSSEPIHICDVLCRHDRHPAPTSTSTQKNSAVMPLWKVPTSKLNA